MACGQCGLVKAVMVQMMPGLDHKPWELCGGCWSEGRKPWKLGRVKVTPISDSHLYNALVSASERTAGLINMDRAHGADDAKASVGDFTKKPRKRKAS